MLSGSVQSKFIVKSSSLPSLLQRSLSYAGSWSCWGISLAVNASYSAYHYTRNVLRYEQINIAEEEKQVKKTLSSTERMIANGMSGAVKGTVAAAVIYSGASLPVVGLVSLGLLPKNTAMRLGGKVLGASFQVVLNAQHLAGYALSMMHWTIPANWMQLGLKKGSDAVISFVDSKNLTRLYQDYHVGERIWLWTGAIGSIRNDLRMIPQEYQKTKVTEYQNKEIRGKITDTFQCQNKWLFWDECRIQERHLIEQDLLRNTVRNGILRSENDGHSWMPVTYEHVSDAKSYRAEYENGRVVRESKISHLPSISNHLLGKSTTQISPGWSYQVISGISHIINPVILLLILVKKPPLVKNLHFVSSMTLFCPSVSPLVSVMADEIDLTDPQKFNEFLISLRKTYNHDVQISLEKLFTTLQLTAISADIQTAVLNLNEYLKIPRWETLQVATVSVNQAIGKIQAQEIKSMTDTNRLNMLQIVNATAELKIKIHFHRAFESQNSDELTQPFNTLNGFDKFFYMEIDRFCENYALEKGNKYDIEVVQRRDRALENNAFGPYGCSMFLAPAYHDGKQQHASDVSKKYTRCITQERADILMSANQDCCASGETMRQAPCNSFDSRLYWMDLIHAAKYCFDQIKNVCNSFNYNPSARDFENYFSIMQEEKKSLADIISIIKNNLNKNYQKTKLEL